MKKSKVLIPAMALLLFSTAASITGTVAWFTSSRVFETSVGNFSVVEVDGGLSCVMAPIANAGTVTGTTANTVKVADGVVLTHGSVDHTSGKAFTLDPESSVENPSFLDRGASSAGTWKYRNQVKIKDNATTPVERTVDVYVAVAWTMTFTYTFNSEAGPIGVYFDPSASEFSDETGLFTKPVASGKTEDTAKGFRIAFMGGHNVVWGNNSLAAGTGNHSTKRYVKATTGADNVKYGTYVEHSEGETVTQGDYIVEPDNSKARYVDNASTSGTKCKTTDLERICTLTSGTSGTSSATITCAAWFEGTDPNVISGAAMKCLSANMVFYARSDAAAA